MRKNLRPTEAQEIGRRIRAARKRTGTSLVEVARVIGVHYSQVIRYEYGAFKTVSPNVRKMCMFFQIKHPKLTVSNATDQAVRDRFDALLDSIPGSAMAFSTLFDMLEASIRDKQPRKKSRRAAI